MGLGLISAFPRGLRQLFNQRAAPDRQHRPQERPKTDNIGPKAAEDRQHRLQERPKTANIRPKSGPGPPTYAPRATQDRAQRPQERLKTAHKGPGAAQDRQHRSQERPKTANIGPQSGPGPHTEARQLHNRPSIENIEEKVHRQKMLPVNFRTDRRATCPLSISL